MRRNTIVSEDLLATRIVGHPFKYESHRLAAEKSEDQLSYGVFCSFQEAGCLNYIARLITGLDYEDEPRLFLWGIELTDDCLIPQGQRSLKRCADKYFQHERFAPAAGTAFSYDAVLAGMLFEQG